MSEVEFRVATCGDAEPIAALHAESWRLHYRGAYAAEFLDGDVLTDRLQTWQDRLRAADQSARTILAEIDGQLIGFAHTILDADPTWGALLDNLHVSVTQRRRGIGAALMARSATFVLNERASSGIYLWVLAQNHPAQRFYRALGGQPADTAPVPPIGGDPSRLDGQPVGIRYVWHDPTTLICRQQSHS